MPYTIEEHQHRFAAWAASGAASRSPLCRFKVQLGFAILEASGFTPAFFKPSQLPTPDCVDVMHRRWRKAVIEAAKTVGLNFNDGIAAKLINVYLKTRFVCGGHHNDERVKCLHPPIEEVLLQELAAKDFGGHAKQWRKFRQARWSKFDSVAYEDVIALIRKSLPLNAPLWKIEEHFKGYQ